MSVKAVSDVRFVDGNFCNLGEGEEVSAMYMYRGVRIISSISDCIILLCRANCSLFLCIFSVFMIIVTFSNKVSLFLEINPNSIFVFPLGDDL